MSTHTELVTGEYSPRLERVIANTCVLLKRSRADVVRALHAIPRAQWRTMTDADALQLFKYIEATSAPRVVVQCRACKAAGRRCDRVVATGKQRAFRRNPGARVAPQHECRCTACGRVFWSLDNPEPTQP